MKPSDLVAANVSFHKLNSAIDDLAFIERSKSESFISAQLSHEAKAQILEFARTIGIKYKTDEIKSSREFLREAGIEIDDTYIDQRLEQCREARTASETTAWDRAERRRNGATPVETDSSVIAFNKGH